MVVTDNERIQEIRECVETDPGWTEAHHTEYLKFLLQQLEQQDKTIAEILRADNDALARANKGMKKSLELKEQNTIMLSALKQIAHSTMSMGYVYAEDFGNDLKRIACDTIAKVKALTVSEKEVTENSVDPSEPTI